MVAGLLTRNESIWEQHGLAASLLRAGKSSQQLVQCDVVAISSGMPAGKLITLLHYPSVLLLLGPDLWVRSVEDLVRRMAEVLAQGVVGLKSRDASHFWYFGYEVANVGVGFVSSGFVLAVPLDIVQ
jgi:hypothetical protein